LLAATGCLAPKESFIRRREIYCQYIETPERCSDCDHGKARHAIWGPVSRCYACEQCWGWDPPADVGERRARPAERGAATSAESEWSIREWDGSAWHEVAVVRGEAARVAAMLSGL
jgi:hypothetical protein